MAFVLPPSAPEVTAYFSALQAGAVHEYGEHVAGGDRLLVTSYVTDAPPPERYVRSVRCVVLRGEWVLGLRGEDYAHVLPGGKREPGEEPIFLDVRETTALSLLERSPWRRENRLFLREAIRLLGKSHIRLA